MSLEDDSKYWANWAEGDRDPENIPVEDQPNIDRVSRILDAVDSWSVEPLTDNMLAKVKGSLVNGEAGEAVKTKSKWWLWALLIGVSLAGVSLFLTTGFLDTTIAVETERGESLSLLLPDESEAILNNLTKIEYTEDFWSGQRDAVLIGEAHLSVVHGEQFTIHAGDAEVELIAGEVNVFSREGLVIVDCSEGKAIIRVKNEEMEIESGQRASYMRGAGLKKRTIQPVSGSPWIEGKTRFDHASLIHVLTALEVRFNVEAEVSVSKDTNDRVFTGYIYHDDLEKSVKSLVIPLGLHYEISGKTIHVY